MIFSQKDIKQFSEKGISLETVEQQIKYFKNGFPYINIIKAATINKGIVRFDETESEHYIQHYDSVSDQIKPVKFVPASGAASRMFKSLFEFKDDSNADINAADYSSVKKFFDNIEKFAFFEDLVNLKETDCNYKKDYHCVLKLLLSENGLNYGNLPKALLKFHLNEGKGITPIDEHFIEAAAYSSSGGKTYLHFTVSPEHKNAFESYTEQIKINYEHKFNLSYEIEFSVQKPSTDTIAVNLENIPFRENDGTILFRPGGHGALIQNLNEIDADIIFIKNIDNVVPEKNNSETIKYKKILAGYLLSIQTQIFEHIKLLIEKANDKVIEETEKFLSRTFFIKPDKEYASKNKTERINYLLKKLNRPIRVCGMVKNEGEPGGGPFFVEKNTGSVSLQIVEGAQINLNSTDKSFIVNNATHFNPVDLVISVKDYMGNAFNLTDFVDPQTGFISYKSKDGSDLKAQELPGLWNGAMSDWNTVFAEVPVSTFNPVKEVNDLLRKMHQ